MICAYILKRLGCEVYGINTEPTGEFSHGAEPVPENIGELCSLVHEKGADIGFAVDPDVDRLSLVDEKGKAIGEEYSLALAVDYCMSKSVRIAACNLSTSRMIDDVAARHGGTVVRSAVGEINVVELMKEKGAGIGGEGNGGIIYPDLHYGRDAVLGIALILQFMAESNERIGVLADSIPSYTLIKDKRTIGRKGAWIEPLKHAFTGTQVDTRDGMKFIFPDSWVHVRESNTEPIIRIFAEAPSEEKALMLVKKVYEAIN
jgi:phosphomannomutase